jgi:hypothetical protein
MLSVSMVKTEASWTESLKKGDVKHIGLVVDTEAINFLDFFDQLFLEIKHKGSSSNRGPDLLVQLITSSSSNIDVSKTFPVHASVELNMTQSWVTTVIPILKTGAAFEQYMAVIIRGLGDCLIEEFEVRISDDLQLLLDQSKT